MATQLTPRFLPLVDKNPPTDPRYNLQMRRQWGREQLLKVFEKRSYKDVSDILEECMAESIKLYLHCPMAYIIYRAEAKFFERVCGPNTALHLHTLDPDPVYTTNFDLYLKCQRDIRKEYEESGQDPTQKLEDCCMNYSELLTMARREDRVLPLRTNTKENFLPTKLTPGLKSPQQSNVPSVTRSRMPSTPLTAVKVKPSRKDTAESENTSPVRRRRSSLQEQYDQLHQRVVDIKRTLN